MTLAIENFKIYCDVARKKSISRAAEMNHISQSSVSQVISQLEKRLGVQLIDRSTRPLLLTAEGEMFYEGCRDIVERYYEMESKIESLHKDTIQTINVASIYSVGLYDMNQYIRRFKSIHPNGVVHIDYKHPQKIYESLLNDEYDLGLISFARNIRSLTTIHWKDEPMMVTCSPAHRFAKLIQINPRIMDNENFIAFDEELPIRRHVDKFLRSHGVDVNIVMQFDNIEAIKRAVEIDAGISLLPEPTLRKEVEKGSLAMVPLAGKPFIRPLSIIHRKNRIISPALKSFIDLILEGQNGKSIDLTEALLVKAG